MYRENYGCGCGGQTPIQPRDGGCGCGSQEYDRERPCHKKSQKKSCGICGLVDCAKKLLCCRCGRR